MITVGLQGGMGNQLFQWALGKAFEERGQEVQFDTGLFDHDPGRRYMLDQLGLDLKVSHHGGRGMIIQEGRMRYKPGLLDLTGDATLIGYWQTEKYFTDIGADIRKSIVINESKTTAIVADSIASLGEKSCAVHVRRSDNLRTAGVAVHGLLSATGCMYYERAMNAMRERVRGVQFFMFSDDPDWCRENFDLPDVTVVGHNKPSFTVDQHHDLHFQEGGREAEDFFLMYVCQHAIIANSTFSWWPAWLADETKNHIVYAPEPWFASLTHDASDIIPERWGKIAIR